MKKNSKKNIRNKNNNTYIKIGIIFACFLIVFSVIFHYIKNKNLTIIPGNELNISNENIIAVHQGNQLVDNVPTKGSAWIFDRADCTNGATATWDYNTWSLHINDLTTNTKCELYFVAKRYISDQIKDIVSGSNDTITDKIDKGTAEDGCTFTFAYDGTVDKNLRYVGKNPCNYVKFNNEFWRIIGVMNNIQTDENNSNQKESLVKLERYAALGLYSWDSSASGINYAYGINQWGESTYENNTAYEGADLMRELNTDYLGTITVGTDGKWFSTSQERRNTAMPETTISSSAQAMIQPVIWNTAAANNNNGTPLIVGNASMIASFIYEHERGNLGGKVCPSPGNYCTDTVNRAFTWYGKVGLMYASDYAYATGGGTATAQLRNACLGYSLGGWSNYTGCYTNDWLYDSANNQWTMTPAAVNNYALRSVAINTNGVFVYNNGYVANNVRPVVYLKSNIYINSGDGSSTTPFTLEYSN